MVSIGERIVNGALNGAVEGIVFGVVGAAGGFIYAKLADLPAHEAAKAWAVWVAARKALSTFTWTVFENGTARLLASTLIGVASIIGIEELTKRGVMGEKMKIFLFVLNALDIANNVVPLFCCPNTFDEEAIQEALLKAKEKIQQNKKNNNLTIS